MLKMLKDIKRYAILSILIFCAESPVPANALQESERLKEFKETRPYFGAYFTVNCRYDPLLTDIEKVMTRCWGKLDEINRTMNPFSATGDVAMINSVGYPDGVKVSGDVYRIVGDSIEYSKKTGGVFDITVMPLVRVWKKAEKENVLPGHQDLKSALEKVGSEKYISLGSDQTVRISEPGVQIDLSAIAPPFAVDEIASILTENKIQHFMVDGSGEIVCRGNQPGQKGWRIGVQDPAKKPDEKVIDILSLENYAVSTSGSYERYYTIQGHKYSHVIDPHTGQPAQGVISATAIAPTAEEANVFSTALCVLGGAAGIKLVDSIPDVQALVLEERQGEIITWKTKGYDQFQADPKLL